jgi:hypothetical protein
MTTEPPIKLPVRVRYHSDERPQLLDADGLTIADCIATEPMAEQIATALNATAQAPAPERGERCDHKYEPGPNKPTVRCDLPAGHASPHIGGHYAW